MNILDRVKRDVKREMDTQSCHTGLSWADIMLRHSTRLTKLADQKLFWEWLMDPTEERDPGFLSFESVNPEKIQLLERYTVACGDDEKSEDITMVNTIRREGLVTFITSAPDHS